VVVGKKVLQWKFMLQEELIMLEISLMIRLIVIFVCTTMQEEEERGLAMWKIELEGTPRGDRKTMTGPESMI